MVSARVSWWRRFLPSWRHPARIVVFGFGAATAFGTVLLMLPVATESGEGTGLIAALFTAVSAVCVTGLVVVDTPTHWSTFGELVVLGLIQVGGFGIMTLASLLTLLVSRRLGLRSKYGVTVAGVKRPGEGFTCATAETVVNRGDVLILAGRTAEVEQVADLT